jgi:nicotinic acid phosphoribosyltransferase
MFFFYNFKMRVVTHLFGSRLHDFGFRGCTSLEQAIIGGTAHLLNFNGTDTMPAAYYVQNVLNNGKPVAQSIPATEHSVILSHLTEYEAMKKLIELYGSDIYACVMDSYDYVNALEKLLPALARYKIDRGGILILRPDSGEPVNMVLKALE